MITEELVDSCEAFDMSHVFISYVRENQEQVNKLCAELAKHGVKVWLDKNDIKAGSRWQDAIEEAIREGAFFISCFSKEYNERNEAYMNEELTLAVDRLRKLSTDRIWFIPVKLNECEIPKRRISDVEKLTDLQWVELYKNWDEGIWRILESIADIATDSTEKSQIRPDQIISPELLLKEIETIQNQAEIALLDVDKIVSTISPRISLVKPEKILRRHLDSYSFRFNGQFTIINSERCIIFHKEKAAIGRYYNQFLPEYDRIYESHVIGNPNGILRVIDFLLTEPRLLTDLSWIRFNVSPFLYFEY